MNGEGGRTRRLQKATSQASAAEHGFHLTSLHPEYPRLSKASSIRWLASGLQMDRLDLQRKFQRRKPAQRLNLHSLLLRTPLDA